MTRKYLFWHWLFWFTWSFGFMLYDAMIDVWSAALIQLMLCIVIAYHWGESDPESQHS